MAELRILHVDMDAFYAAVEQRDRPELRGRPVVVGGDPRSRGVVSTASYEARACGVHSAMPLRRAYDLCPQAVFLPVDMKKYARVSAAMRELLRRYTPVIEPISLDEAFCDLSGQDAVAAGRAIKAAIREELGLTASVGVAPNKFLAKLASDLEKPDGFTILRAEDVPAVVHPLPVRKLWGIGPRSEAALHAMGIMRIGDLLKVDPELLHRRFGRRAEELVRLARGLDDRRVEPNQEAKSISEETTFSTDTGDRARLEAALRDFAAAVAERLARHRVRARTVTLKVRYEDFEAITRSVTLPVPTDAPDELFAAAAGLLARVSLRKRVRLIGLGTSGLRPADEPVQLRFPFA